MHPKRLAEPARFGKAKNGVLSDTHGLERRRRPRARVRARRGAAVDGDHRPQPRSDIFAAARRTLELEVALLGGVALLDLAILLWIFRRAAPRGPHRERARRCERRRRYEREHQVATTLQRSLLAAVPEIDGVESAARYQAGSTGLEVGGDWFDVVRRPDGIVQVTVGDVAGRGVAAAALMGQLRNAFRAYAYEHASPAAVMSRLQRHMVQDEMATAICIAVDPYTRELAYASAGHPPPLLRDDDSGSITPLSGAQFSLLGPVAVKPVVDARLALPARATLIAYTDGMVERRDEVIDAGIERLASAFGAAGREVPADELADRLLRDVARGHGRRRRHRPARAALRRRAGGGRDGSARRPAPALAEARRRIGVWLAARGVGEAARRRGAARGRARRSARRSSRPTRRRTYGDPAARRR